MFKVQHCDHFSGKNQIIKASLVLPPTFCHAIIHSHEMGFRDNNYLFSQDTTFSYFSK